MLHSNYIDCPPAIPPMSPYLAHGHIMESEGPKHQLPQSLVSLSPALLGVKRYHQIHRKSSFSVPKCHLGAEEALEEMGEARATNPGKSFQGTDFTY